MNWKNAVYTGALVLGLAVALVSARPNESRPATAAERLFTVVGGDYISPLITSPKALQMLNLQLAEVARFAGYDQLKALVPIRGLPEVVNVTRFSGELFSLLGSDLLIDCRAEAGLSRVFISERFWREAFDGAIHIAGETLRVSGETFQVAGVLRTSSALLAETDIWVPVCSRGPYGTMTALRVIGELRPGANWQAGEKDLALVVKKRLVREQVVELDTVHLLPMDRKVHFYAQGVEQLIRTT